MIRLIINRIMRLVAILFTTFSLIMVLGELAKPTLSGLERASFFGYVLVAILLSVYSYIKSR